jgi:GTP-binding protein
VFKDEIIIKVKAGDGGRGCISFRREKFVPRGGPDGGCGGKGGDVILLADRNLNTLYHLTHIARFEAQSGRPGGPRNSTGKSGKDLLIRLPCGTIIRDLKKDVVLKDLDRDGERIVVARGGRGGRGNKSFATPRDRTPARATEGEPGEERLLKLELKLIADVGIVGLPNAGKSTLLSKLSRARPKIANFPFTTLTPYLGILQGEDYKTCVLADLPGVIEGAHQGRGLGDKFLRHIERTRIILHLVDVSADALIEPLRAYQMIRRELEHYSPAVAEKREIIVANKMDLKGSARGYKNLSKKLGRELIPISALKSKGLTQLTRRIFEELEGLWQ